jgi:hypothetical protein
MANSNPDINGIINYAKIKSDNALRKVEETLKKMIRQQMKINFNSVAEEAGVSKGFIYKYQDLRLRIETLRQQQEGMRNTKQVKYNMSNASKNVVVATLRNKIKVLEKENKEIKELLKINFGKVYESI